MGNRLRDADGVLKVNVMHVARIAVLGLMVALAACGPIHPRWQNSSSHDIVVTYLRAGKAYATSIRAGHQGVPVVTFDFQTVEMIKVRDGNEMLRFSKEEVSRLHDACGHGYACWFTYNPDHRITVSDERSKKG